MTVNEKVTARTIAYCIIIFGIAGLIWIFTELKYAAAFLLVYYIIIAIRNLLFRFK